MAEISSFEVPTQIRDVAETSLEQARKVFGSFIRTARRACDTGRDSAQEIAVPERQPAREASH